jgi:hypothetical protein
MDFSERAGWHRGGRSEAPREKITVTERPDGGPAPDRVAYVYSYVQEEWSRPEIIESAGDDRPPGMVRRAWRRF